MEEAEMDGPEREPANLASDGAGYLATARRIGPQLAAVADEIEQRGELPAAILAMLVDNGFFRLLLPRSVGGGELDPISFVSIAEEIARHDASTAWCLGQANGCSMTAAYLDPAVAQTIFGPANGVVAWGPGPGSIAAVPGGYRLTGSWSFASGSHHATWLGAHVPEPDGSGEIRTLLFPKTSAKLKNTWRTVGLRGTGSDSYSVSDLFVPAEFTVLRGPAVRPREPGRLYRFTRGNLYASGYAGVALGIARGMVDDFVDLARGKVPQGAKTPLRENNVIQATVAQAEAQLRAARSLLLGTLGELWEAAGGQERLSREQNASLRLAATWAIHQARDVVTMLYHAAGSTAIFNDNPFERRFRDMHTASQQSQGRLAHLETVGQVLLGMEPRMPMFTF
jgi:alkylation response protein AidB-like acyl-CoA dehydrogenase